MSNISDISSYIQQDDSDSHFVLSQTHFVGAYHSAPLGHIILTPNKQVFALSLWYCALSREATNIVLQCVFRLLTTEPSSEYQIIE